ncbi:nitrogen fixation protein FixH [Ancylobacter sp. 3268]|uniref:FixH family protein n=1 Tax=Ancylobacter sp. 3268 TaxID=2817752 RepID=UPI00286070AA|nr:FixH family protein [Ancylobacter sp. 3268]MDR6954523.1 nitrogen fixation protein FixH [Ancylobacter sp. 3268]
MMHPLASAPNASAAGRPLTGRMVLACFVGFFGVVFLANFILVRAALSSFGGVETESSYKAGLAFAREADAAARQEALHWQVAAHVADGVFEASARDAADQPLPDLAIAAVLHHPTDRRLDIVIDAEPAGPGVWRAAPAVPPGQWALMIDLSRHGERQFRSQNRVWTR